MIVAPLSPGSVSVEMIHTGCLKAEFDSTYPIHLNGIINPDEFRQSISNINRTIGSRSHLIICGIIVGLCIITGFILFIVGGITAVNSRTHRFPVLVSIGFGAIGFAIFCLIVGRCVIQSKRINRMRQAVAEESMKYSMRSLTPCSWRLNVTRIWSGGYRNQHPNQHVMYHLIIETGRNAAVDSSPIPSQSTPYFSRQDNIPPPPAYPGGSAGFGSQCDMHRQDRVVNYCSSCGHRLNKY